MQVYGYLADAIVALHVGYVAFIVVGQLLILIGWILRWRWIRNFWFRMAHLIAIAIVAGESLWGIVCPLTKLENHLREMAGQEVSNASFLGRWLHSMIFLDCPQRYFDVSNVLFATLVLVTFLMARPHWPWRQPNAG